MLYMNVEFQSLSHWFLSFFLLLIETLILTFLDEAYSWQTRSCSRNLRWLGRRQHSRRVDAVRLNDSGRMLRWMLSVPCVQTHHLEVLQDSLLVLHLFMYQSWFSTWSRVDKCVVRDWDSDWLCGWKKASLVCFSSLSVFICVVCREMDHVNTSSSCTFFL